MLAVPELEQVLAGLESGTASPKRPRRAEDDDDTRTFRQALSQAYATAARDLAAVLADQTHNAALGAAAAGSGPDVAEREAVVACLRDTSRAPLLVAALGSLVMDAPAACWPTAAALGGISRPVARLGAAGPRGARAAWLALHRRGLPGPVAVAVWGHWLGPDDIATASSASSMPLCDLMVGAAFAVRDELSALGAGLVGRWVLWCSGQRAALLPTPLHFTLLSDHPPLRHARDDSVLIVPVHANRGLFRMSA